MEMRIDYLAAGTGGVYWDRVQKKNRAEYMSPDNSSEDVKSAGEVREQLTGVTLTMSPESEEFTARLAERKALERAQQLRVQQENDPLQMQNPFDRIGTQFATISKALTNMGYYDNLSDEEVLETETLLANITYGMNNLCGNLRVENDDQLQELSSYAARFELESSTAALRQFANKYLPEHMQERFQGLVDKYYEHNSKALEGYRSNKEIMSELQARIYDRTENARVIGPSEAEQMKHLYGKVKVKDEEINSAVNDWRACFRDLSEGNQSVKDVMGRIQGILNRLASGNSKNKMFLQYVNEWNIFPIENAKLYWSALV